MKQPNLDFSNTTNTMSTNIVNNRGDRIEPCLTPEIRGNGSDMLSPHLTVEKLLVNQFSKTFTIDMSTL